MYFARSVTKSSFNFKRSWLSYRKYQKMFKDVTSFIESFELIEKTCDSVSVCPGSEGSLLKVFYMNNNKRSE